MENEISFYTKSVGVCADCKELLYPYRIITLGSNKHNGDGSP